MLFAVLIYNGRKGLLIGFWLSAVIKITQHIRIL